MTSQAQGDFYRIRVIQGSSAWEFAVDKKTFTLGRTDVSNVKIPIQVLSAVHLEFTHVEGDTWSIVDKKSTNGTAHNNSVLEHGKAYQLKFPTQLRIGKATELYIEIESVSKVEAGSAKPRHETSSVSVAKVVAAASADAPMHAAPAAALSEITDIAKGMRPNSFRQNNEDPNSDAHIAAQHAAKLIAKQAAQEASQLAAAQQAAEQVAQYAAQQAAQQAAHLAAQKAAAQQVAAQQAAQNAAQQAAHFAAQQAAQQSAQQAMQDSIQQSNQQAAKLAESIRDLEHQLTLLESKVSKAKTEEQLYHYQTKEAQKFCEEAEQRKVSEEQKLADLRRDYDQKQAELFEITQRLDSQRHEYEDIQKKIKETEGDIQGNEQKLHSRLEEIRQSELNYADLQRKIAIFIDQEKDLKKSVENYKSEADMYRSDRDTKLKLLEEVKKKIESVEADEQEKLLELAEIQETLKKHESLLREALDKESLAHTELHKTLKLISEKEIDTERIYEKLEVAQKEVEEKQKLIDQINSDIEKLRKAQIAEEKEGQLLNAKLQTIRDSFQFSESQRKASEAGLDLVRTEVLAAEGKLKRMSAETAELESRLDSARAELTVKNQKVVEVQASLKQLEDSEKIALQEYHAKTNALNAELEKEIAVKRAAVDDEIAEKKAELEEWEQNEKERLKGQFSSQGEKLQRDLNEKKQKELKQLEAEKIKWNKEREARRPVEIKEIVRSVTELLGVNLQKANVDAEKFPAIQATFKKDVEEIVHSVLATGKGAQVQTHLKKLLVQSPDATLKAKKKRITWAIQTAGLMIVLTLGFTFREAISEKGRSFMSRSPQSASVFVERIREARANRPKFLPQRDRVFRNSFTDNLIYLQDYAEIRNDEELLKAWTLALNKFFLEKLGFDEKAIVTYMAIENPLVKELSQMSTKIQVQTQDADISGMRSYEEMTKPRLVEAVKGEENLKKIRDFELHFYDDYSKKIK
jgi:hypothetical protein